MGMIGQHGALGDGKGFLRASYSSEETAALEAVRLWAVARGFHSFYDRTLNLITVLEGDSNEIILTGSHMDTVRNGGNFDGAAGIMGGLLALNAIRERGTPMKTIAVGAWRGEESAHYLTTYKGVMAALGILPPDTLNRTESLSGGITLENAIIRESKGLQSVHGRNPNEAVHLIKIGTPGLDLLFISNIRNYIELHVEQGPVLERVEKDIGIVTQIDGTLRFTLEVYGSSGHSGATPMFERKQAPEMLCEIIHAVGLLGISLNNGRMNEYDEKVRITPSVAQWGDDQSKIAQSAWVRYDIRSGSSDILTEVYEKIRAKVSEIAKRRNQTYEFKDVKKTDPTTSLSETMQDLAETLCPERGYSSVRMESWAGHDARIFHDRGIPSGMIFVPSIGGFSHDPREYTTTPQLVRGVNVLTDALWHLANH